VVNGGTSAARARAARTVKTADAGQPELSNVLRNRAAEEKPQSAQKERTATQAKASPLQKTGTDDMELLDIPAFLRRQAD